MRLQAYYYGFDPTGEEPVDRILSAVACAGKAYHHTEMWNEETPPYEDFFRGANPAEWIQNAAIGAAADLTRTRSALRAAVEALGQSENALKNIFTAIDQGWWEINHNTDGEMGEGEDECPEDDTCPCNGGIAGTAGIASDALHAVKAALTAARAALEPSDG